MISFKDQLPHVIFSHCKYSLKAGRGADIKYDFPALEKHILDRFVRGKPLITCYIPVVSYRNDALNPGTFSDIRKKIAQVITMHDVLMLFTADVTTVTGKFAPG